VRQGEAVEVLEAVRRTWGIAALRSHQETGNGVTYARDRRVAAWARAHGIAWHQPRQHGTIRGLGSRDGWAREWDRFMAQPPALPPRALPPLTDCGVAVDPGPIPRARALGMADDPCPGRQRGGRRAGLETLESFLRARGRDYRRGMSSPVTGFEACSRLSAHFAWGTVSLREASQAAKDRLARLREMPDPPRGWKGSLDSFLGRLHWHCHFMQKLEDEPRLEFENLHPAYDALDKPFDRGRFEAWAEGRTGLPFVDACMRALIDTGWMNFRMRAMLQAVASYHLWLPWRPTGLHLARLFTDYEAGIHWPQTQMQSGTTGINTVRIYNPVKQGLDQDPDGAFTRRWVPELAEVPDRHLQAPWRWDGAGRLDYPAPVVDHLAAARAARDAIWGLRRAQSYRQDAEAIQAKHGSRRSGLPNAGRRRGAAKDGRQSELKL
jgi:deoxyribodipyrimidine photo-lyase